MEEMKKTVSAISGLCLDGKKRLPFSALTRCEQGQALNAGVCCYTRIHGFATHVDLENVLSLQ